MFSLTYSAQLNVSQSIKNQKDYMILYQMPVDCKSMREIEHKGLEFQMGFLRVHTGK